MSIGAACLEAVKCLLLRHCFFIVWGDLGESLWPFDPVYIEIRHLFGDSEQSAFPIHNLLQAGRFCGLAAGAWVGPYAMCRSWEALPHAEMEKTNLLEGYWSLPMAVYIVSGDEGGERGGAPVIYIERAAKLCCEFCKGEDTWGTDSPTGSSSSWA